MSCEKNKGPGRVGGQRSAAASRAKRAGIRRINVRIAALFSVLFALTALLLLGGIYYTVKTSLDQADFQFIQHKLLEYWAKSQTRSIESFITGLDGSSMELEGTPYFLRVADSANRTIFFMFPQGWKGFFPEDIFEETLKPDGGILYIRSPRHEYTLIAADIRLEDDYILQIGVSTERTEKMIKLIVRNFSILLIPLLILSIAGGSILTARMLAPIQKLADAAGNIVDTGNLTARIHEGRAHDELHDLVTLFNRMLEHIEALVRGMQGTLDAVAHDLRTPLTRFRGMAELALQGTEDPRRLREALQDGLEEAERIITELNAIMDLSAAQTGILKLNRERTDMAELCRQLIEMYSYIADESSIRITFSQDAGSAEIQADAARLRRVVGNLLDNAVKYSPDGALISVRLYAEPQHILLEVLDTGPGIPAEDMPRIWERLYRGAGARSKPGLGIGLSIAKAITEAHGGAIGAEPAPGGGMKFWVRLPR
ncbi:MAG: HAMP domain-containing protein [Spirochaetales bacterium]|jgi:signal transduction histidine kinase|nr:HAMP domain-containing protein [Spirochaetales bacterium]